MCKVLVGAVVLALVVCRLLFVVVVVVVVVGLVFVFKVLSLSSSCLRSSRLASPLNYRHPTLT